MDTKELDTFIDEQVQAILATPTYASLSPEKRTEMSATLSDHMHRIIVDTVLTRLTPDQVTELQALLTSDTRAAEEKMMELSAGIPGLVVDLQDRVQREVEALKQI